MQQIKFVIGICVLGFVLTSSCCPCKQNQLTKAALDNKVSHALNYSKQQLTKTITQLNADTTRFPEEAILGKDTAWKTTNSYRWGSGYFPGMMWYMYEDTNKNFWKQNASAWTRGLEKEKNDITHHDIGLIIGCSFGNGYRLTNDDYYKQIVIAGASSLAKRFNPTVGCTRSWGKIDNKKNFTVIIDNLVCLELLFMGAKFGGEKDWYNMAVTHALTTIKNHIRNDGSTYHVIEYHPITGKVIKKRSHQGFEQESCWARGQAWGIHGYTMTYRETSDPRFLKTAQTLADYFIANLPPDYVPYWDFRHPDIPNVKKDTSAAAIAASGLFELSTLVKDKKAARKYFYTASQILNSLCSHPYLSQGSPSPAILLRMTYGVKDASDKNLIGSWVWGDYYFVEAMMRYKNITESWPEL